MNQNFQNVNDVKTNPHRDVNTLLSAINKTRFTKSVTIQEVQKHSTNHLQLIDTYTTLPSGRLGASVG